MWHSWRLEFELVIESGFEFGVARWSRRSRIEESEADMYSHCAQRIMGAILMSKGRSSE